jgi:hypothetical protein
VSTDPTQQPGRSWADFWAKYRTAILPLAVSLSSALIGSVLTYFGAPAQVVEVIKEVEKIIPAQGAPPDEFEGVIDRNGWQPDAEASARDAKLVEFRTFADTPAGQAEAGELPKAVYLWQAETKLTGKPTPLFDQNPEGSCVGHGTARAIERSLAADIVARGGHPSEFTHFSEEVMYIGSRNQGAEASGARPMSPRQQGSAGVFAKNFATKFGAVPKAKYASADLTTYSASRCAAWRSSGLPAELVAVAKQFPVRDGAKVANWKECKSALASGYSTSICSTLSFSRTRDANGVAQQTREGWNHCMCIDGYHVDPATGREYGHVENSWTNLPDKFGNRTGQAYHTGPTGWGNPTTAGFWASAEVLDSGLRQGESYAYSGVTGFPKKIVPLNWDIRAEPAGGIVHRAQDRRAREPIQLLAVNSLAW